MFEHALNMLRQCGGNLIRVLNLNQRSFLRETGTFIFVLFVNKY